ncbi:MAG TPA: NUDIX hydrolase [Patescibacteria group bacterium]|nr:NUDIX hydrolase [Patescibacteria group bacterium]
MDKLADEATNKRRGIDHVGVTVCSIIHDGTGRVLLMKRGQEARDERGNWDICGGALEHGESLVDAIEREVKEELCAAALDIKFLGAGEAHRVNHEGQKTHWIWLMHSALVDPQQVKIGEPHKIDEIGWFTEKSLPSPRHSQFPHAYKAAKAAGILK